MGSSNSTEIPKSEPETETVHPPKGYPIAKTDGNPAEKEIISGKVSEDTITEENGDEDGEEEGECGFCLFLKAGGCGETFTAWEKCGEEGRNNKEDIVEKCSQLTAALIKCMEVHSDYYAPVLKAKEVMAEGQFEEEKAGLNNGDEGKKQKEENKDDSDKKETS